MTLPSVAKPSSASPENHRFRQIVALNRKLRRQVYDFHNLFEILLELTTIRDRETLLYGVLVNLIGLSGAEGGAILLSAADSDDFVPARARGLSFSQLAQLRFAPDHPIVIQLKKNPFPWLAIENPQPSDGQDSANHPVCPGISLVAPITQHDDLLGLAALGPRVQGTPYTEQEIEIISLLNNFAAIVLSNVALYEKMERLSTTDALTGLHNRRSFEDILSNELARAQRFGLPLSLAMVDVDHFKNYNDTAGHPAGDTLLRELAHLMQQTVRRTDYVARYGGEEFAIILPAIESNGAVALCERLRLRVASHDFEYRHVQHDGQVTASFGTASFPADALEARSLIAQADAALYTAKRRGRNQTVAHQAGQENQPS
jgi:diguanylate cyclase (GGDEF)-like protein